MDVFMDALWKVLEAMLKAAIPVVAAFLCNLIHKAAQRLNDRLKAEKASDYAWEIESAVRAAVNYVNQTFVDALKSDPAAEFGEEEQETAFNEAYETAVVTISDAALDYLVDKFGDIRTYLTVKIEEAVRDNKKR